MHKLLLCLPQVYLMIYSLYHQTLKYVFSFNRDLMEQKRIYIKHLFLSTETNKLTQLFLVYFLT